MLQTSLRGIMDGSLQVGHLGTQGHGKERWKNICKDCKDAKRQSPNGSTETIQNVLSTPALQCMAVRTGKSECVSKH